MYVRLADLTAHFDDHGALVLRSQAHSLGARVPPPAAAILAFCSEPRTREQVAARFGPPMAGLFDGLVDAGFLTDPGSARGTPQFFANFAGLEIHRRMLADHVRVDAYAAAIARAVEPGMAVLDAGTGSGLLAMLAARAGARVVYAVDNSDVLELAEACVRAQGLADVVRIIRGDFANVELPEKVDVIVSETFGALALAEGSVPDLGAAVERHLAPGGIVVPDRVDLVLAPLGDLDLLRATLGPFEMRHGVDFAPLRASACSRGRVVDISAQTLLAPGAPFARLRYPTSDPPRGALSFSCSGGPWTGFAAWFDVAAQGQPMFSTAPAAASTHWKQVYLPLDPVDLPAGASLDVNIDVRPAPDDRRSLEVRASWDGASTGSRTWRVR